MHIEWSGELFFVIFILGLISLAGFMLIDQYIQKKQKKS